MAVKKTNKHRSVSSRNIDDHIVEKAKVTEVSADTKDVSGLDSKSNLQWDVTKGEVHSDVRLEEDMGVGQKVILRTFRFSANPQAFREKTPSKQELFDAHAKQIEIFLYKDGFVRMEGVEPKLFLSKDRLSYYIIVAAVPKFGEYTHERALTLKDITNGPR